MSYYAHNPDDLTSREEQELIHGKETPDEQYRRLCREWGRRALAARPTITQHPAYWSVSVQPYGER